MLPAMDNCWPVLGLMHLDSAGVAFKVSFVLFVIVAVVEIHVYVCVLT